MAALEDTLVGVNMHSHIGIGHTRWATHGEPSDRNAVSPTLSDDVLVLPAADEILAPMLNVIPLQLLAYHICVAKGYDVDKPRNLAKGVTVE